MRKLALLMALTVCSLPALAQSLIIRTAVPPGLTAPSIPVLVDLSVSDLKSAFKVSSLPHNQLITASDQATHAALPAQLSQISDTEARACILLPAQPSGPRTILLNLAPSQTPQPSATLSTFTTDGVITIKNANYTIIHDPAKNAGLPSSITFNATGKVFNTLNMNDRLHSKEPGVGGFNLRDDTQPNLRLVASGPLYAEVRLEARYMAGYKPTPSGAHASYIWTYFAGSPLVRVSAEMSQKEPFSWNELHFLEFHFKDNSFPAYAAVPPLEVVDFTDAKKAPTSSAFGALVDGNNILALSGPARIYDGLSDYGRYLHGAWEAWSTQSASYSADLWVGSDANALQTVQQAFEHGPRPVTGTAYTPTLLAAFAKLRAPAPKLKDPVLAVRLPWLASLIESAYNNRGLSLSDAQKAADDALGLAARGEAPLPFLSLGARRFELLHNDQIGIAFAREGNTRTLASLYDLKRGRELLAEPCELFRFTVLDAAGKTATVTSNSHWLKSSQDITDQAGQTRHALLRWTGLDEKDVKGLEVDLELSLDGPDSLWKLSVANKSGQWSLDRVTCPALAIGALGGDSADDRLLLPDGFGRAYPTTIQTSYSGRYPNGGCAMQWFGVCDDESGIYVGQHDPTAADKLLVVRNPGSGSRTPLSIEVPVENASIPGNDYRMPGTVVIGVTAGGYFPSCAKYRSWLERNAPWWPEPGQYSRSDYPEWVKANQAWSLAGGFPKDCVPQTKALQQALGVPTAIHWYNWHQIPFDDNYPHYFPTKEGFRDGVKELQDAGINVMPYINGRLWDTDTESFKAEAYKYATKQLDGKPYIEVYGSKQELNPMCISQEFWRQTLTDIVIKLVSEEGVNGVYIDQIGAAHPVLCYDKSHGHPLGGGHWWVDGYWKLLDDLQKRIATVGPQKMLTTESNAEPYAKYFDAYLMCNSNSNYEAPLFPAVYGGKILMFGTYMQGADYDDASLMAVRQGKLFAFGTQLWWANPSITNHPVGLKWLRDAANLRQQVNEYFVHGRMATPPTFVEGIPMMESPWKYGSRQPIPIHTPEVWATTWRLADGSLMMPIVNVPKATRTLTLDFNAADYGLKNKQVKVERLGPDGIVETTTQKATFRLPIALSPAEATALRITGQ